MAFDMDDDELKATRKMHGLGEIRDLNDKIIDKMAKFISEQDIDEDICKNENGKLCNDEGTNCIECIKEHFKQEIRNESQNSFENVRCCICGKEIKGIKKCENYVCDHCYNLK